MMNVFRRARGALGAAVVCAFLAFASIAIGGRQSPERTHVTILSTTDMHGNILPVDYYTNKPDNRGLGKLATLIKEARKAEPGLLLIDSGDTIQGTPLVYYHNRHHLEPPDPMMLVMSELGYDAMAVGNHEYNFGLTVLEKARREARFPWLSANTYDVNTDRTHYQPYVVKEVGGLRVGVLGLTTPGIPYWDTPQNYAGLEFHSPLSEAKKWVPVLRTRENVDVVVIAIHSGLGEDLRTGKPDFASTVPNENVVVALAREVPGVDVVLMGHTHRDVPSVVVNGVLLTQADRWASRLARVDLYAERDDPNQRWRVIGKSSRTIPVTDRVAVDPVVARLVQSYDAETQAWLGRSIGESALELSARESRDRDTAIIDLIQLAQLEAGQGDVALSASFNPQAAIHKGAVTVRELAGLYPYENTLVTVELTGQQLKDALEHSARYFREYEPGKRPSELADPRIAGYNFDIAQGVSYEIDLSKAAGQRIQKLTFKGRPLAPDQKLRVVTNNYRNSGGGGYTMLKTAPVLYRSSAEVRDLIIDWVERHRTIPTEPDNNWRIVP